MAENDAWKEYVSSPHSPFDLSFDVPLEGKFQSQQSGQGISQPLHVSSQSNEFMPWESADQYLSVHTGDSSGLIAIGNTGASNNSTNQVADALSNRILFGSEVQPFSRVDDDGADHDLLNVFDDDVGSNSIKRIQMPQPEARTSQSEKDVQSSMLQDSEVSQRNLQVRQFATLRQQEQEEEARMQKFCRVDKPSHESFSTSQNSETDGTFDSDFFVPSTMMPPTVLASTLPSNKRKSVNAISSKHNKKGRGISSGYSPQSRLEELIQQLGILGVERVKADAAEYEVVPSALQLASFGTRFVKAVHTSDEKALSELLQCGLSPNPCNQFRDSILDLVCKQGNAVIFDCFMRHGAELQTMDGFGRTPLHHCCWASTFCRPIVDSILERDPMQLMIEDKRGQTPLEYVRADLASEWIQYLEENVNKYWGDKVPTLSSPKANRPSGTLINPLNAMPVNLASMVSSGKLLPAQVMPMLRDRKRSHI